MNLEQARYFMVEQQIRPWDVLDPQILDILMETPRHKFVDEEYASLAYTDIELPISETNKMLAPKVAAKMLQALAIQSNEKALEIGTGSGYVTALMAQLAKEVTTVEISPEIQNQAIQRLTNYTNINFKTGDASQGWDDNQYYDAILLTGSVQQIPASYKEKLSLGGRLAFVAGDEPAMVAKLITRVSDNEWSEETLFETVLERLVNTTESSAFKF